jgi:preprotein translocase subunit SecA
MFDFLIRKGVIKRAQKYIDQLEPKVQIHVPEELPLPSVKLLKQMSEKVARINALEPDLEKMSDDDLKAKTPMYRQQYHQAVKAEKERLDRLRESYTRTAANQQKDDLNIEIEKAKADFKKAKNAFLDSILPEVFALVREVGKRVLSMRHYDVQMVGGMVLHQGNIAEMTTGEGKTLVATLPAYLNGITGEGVHVVTVNDYLAKRDCEWMGPLFEFLGLSVGVILHDMNPQERQAEYNCDITYGTNNEFGFDYLRDNMVNFKEDMVQRPHHFAIVDEVDSILIDEARTPLIISGPAEQSTDKYYKANEIVKNLNGRRVTEKDQIDAKYKEIDLSEGYDYLADEKAKSISMTEQGEAKAADMFGIDNLHDMETIEYRHHVIQALKAKEFFKRDVDYVVKNGEVIIVDEFTGRLMPGRRWSDGLHQAVEARERIKIERENQTLATITFQNYFRLYEKLSGMTGTAYTEATEFTQIYELDCVVVPTNKRLQRANHPDCVYRSLKEKFHAVVEDIEDCHQRGQPVLVGTISIEKSELLSRMLQQKGIAHQVLNAKYHEQEAHIIAQAGRFKAVTIATNMAGRGTDIVLGGNPEYLAKNLVAQKLSDPKGADGPETEDADALVKKFIKQFQTQCKEEHEKVVSEGGLHVLGTERHESRRIDNQLRGRQGRQGDPGSSRFYVSLEDDLMRLFASDKLMGMMDKLGMEEGQVLEHPWLSRAIETAQRRVEGHNFEIRKHLLEFDNVMNKQREVIYDMRRTVLEREDVKDYIMEAIEDLVYGVVDQHLSMQTEEETFDAEGLHAYFKTTFDLALVAEGVQEAKPKLLEMAREEIIDKVLEGLRARYGQKEEEIGAQHLRHLERMLLLHTIDSKWKDHLYAMDQLKGGVGLRSYGQRDPLLEYKREGFEMFQIMYSSINQEVAELIFKIQPVVSPERPRKPSGVFSSLPQNLVHNEFSGMAEARQKAQAAGPPPAGVNSPSSPGSFGASQGGPQGPASPQPLRKSGPKVGRNDPCPCGSGKKYKKCCGR